MSQNQILIRTAIPSDVNFILNSWLKSWRVCKHSGVIGNNKYYEVTKDVIENLIARGAELKVACLFSDENHILGWICIERIKTGQSVVHYLYIKDPYLTMGVPEALTNLVPDTGFYTFKFNQVREFLPKYKWVPEIARRK